MHPFDPKAVLLAKHAQHVVLVHFPIALFLTGVWCDWWAHWGKRAWLGPVARFNLKAAALLALPVLVTGVLAWQFQLEGQRLKGVLRLHLFFGVVSAVLCWVVAWLRGRAWKTEKPSLPAWHGVLELVAVLAVAITGHLGGFVSGVNLSG